MKSTKKEIQQLENLEIKKEMQKEVKGGNFGFAPNDGIRVNCW